MADYSRAIKVVGGAAVGLVAAPLLTTAAIGAVGFGAAGPIAGTAAAAWQASIGNVAAGSMFSLFQSAAIGGAGAGVVGGISAAAGSIVGAATGAKV